MNCTSCGRAAAADDTFCGNCGVRLRTESPQQQESFIPLPAEPLPKRRKKSRKSSGRKKFLRGLAMFALVSALVIAVSSWYVLSRFDDSQELSEVPDEIELSLEDGDSTVSIDTSSAKLALEQRSQGPQQPSGVATPVNAATTAQPISSPETAVHIETVEETSGITILLMGVDAGTSEQIDVGVRPDSLSVLHLDPENGTCRLLGIPRDSRVELPGYGMSKVNHALAIGGIPYQQLVVEQYLGISIDHYGLVNFEGLVGVCFYPGFVDGSNHTLNRVLDHIDYLMSLLGEDHVAIGPDFIDYMSDFMNDKLKAANVGYLDNPDYPEGISGVHQFHNITTGLLSRGYSEIKIRKILGENYLRVCELAMS